MARRAVSEQWQQQLAVQGQPAGEQGDFEPTDADEQQEADEDEHGDWELLGIDCKRLLLAGPGYLRGDAVGGISPLWA